QNEYIFPSVIQHHQRSFIRISLAHRIARGSVSRCLPGVKEHPAGSVRRSPSGEEADLVGVRRSIEVARDNTPTVVSRCAPAGLRHEVDNGTNLTLSILAAMGVRNEMSRHE